MHGLTSLVCLKLLNHDFWKQKKFKQDLKKKKKWLRKEACLVCAPHLPSYPCSGFGVVFFFRELVPFTYGPGWWMIPSEVPPTPWVPLWLSAQENQPLCTKALTFLTLSPRRVCQLEAESHQDWRPGHLSRCKLPGALNRVMAGTWTRNRHVPLSSKGVFPVQPVEAQLFYK